MAKYFTVAKRIRTSVTIPEETFQHCRDAVAFLSGPPLYMTFAQLVENALNAEVEKLKAAHYQGKPFPHFAGRRKPGRPIGT